MRTGIQSPGSLNVNTGCSRSSVVTKTRCIFGLSAIRQKLTPFGASRILVNRPDCDSRDQTVLAVVQKKRFLSVQVIPRIESELSSCVRGIFRVVFLFRSISSTAGLESTLLIR